jgi:predicted ester cyclase
MASQPIVSSIQQKDTPETRVVREFLAALDRQQKIPAELTAPGLTFVFNSDKPTDLAGWQGLAQAWFGAFPGSKHTVETCESVGDRVFARVRATGIHKGELFGIPPSNRPIDIIGNVQFTVKDGKVARAAPVWDMLTLMQQIGAVPTPAN